MNYRRFFLRSLVMLMAVAMVLTGLTRLPVSHAADHRDSITADANQEGDMTDVFAFLDPEFPDRLVMSLPVNPFANPSELPSYRFSEEFLYQLKIDNNGDSIPDYVVQVKFESDNGAPPQTYKMKFGPAKNPRTPQLNEVVDSELNENQTICSGNVYAGGVSNRASTDGQGFIFQGNQAGVQCFAGIRDDSFVTDVSQAVFRIGLNPNPARNANNHDQDVFRAFDSPTQGPLRGRPLRLDGTSGVDGFGGYNASTIAIEIPKSLVAGPGFPARGTTVIPAGTNVPANTLGIAVGTNPSIPACPGCIGVWGTVSRAKGDHFDPSWIQPFGRPGNNLQTPQDYIQFERMGQQLFSTVFIWRQPPTNAVGEFTDVTDNKVKDVYNRLAPQWDVPNFGYLVPDSLVFDPAFGENSIQGRRALLEAGGFTSPGNGTQILLDQLAPPYNVLRSTNTDKRLLEELLLPDLIRVDLNNPPDNAPTAPRPYAQTASNSSSYFGVLSIGMQQARRPADDVTDIYLRMGRELVDVAYSNPNPPPPRHALVCELLANGTGTCQDPRVSAVLQGTDFVEPTQADIEDLTEQGVDRYNPRSDVIASRFPFFADEHPVPGENTGGGTTGFPSQNDQGTGGKTVR